MLPDNPSAPESEPETSVPSPNDAPIERFNEGDPTERLDRPSSDTSSTRSQDATVRRGAEGGISASYSEHYQGVVAHPIHLSQFDQIVPGSAARMIDWAEDEAKHRRSMERLESDREFDLEKLRIQKETDIQSQAIQAQTTSVTSENQVRLQIGCGAHATAVVALGIGLILSLQKHTTEAIAVFGVLGAIYGGGIVAGVLSGSSSKKKALPPRDSSGD